MFERFRRQPKEPIKPAWILKDRKQSIAGAYGPCQVSVIEHLGLAGCTKEEIEIVRQFLVRGLDKIYYV